MILVGRQPFVKCGNPKRDKKSKQKCESKDSPVTSSLPFPSSKQKEAFVPENDLHQYFNECEMFDWFYEFSDSHRVWENGEREYKRLKSRSRTSPEHAKIFSAWFEYSFSGRAFGTDKKERPEWESYREAH